jgi:hypothetical protein
MRWVSNKPLTIELGDGQTGRRAPLRRAQGFVSPNIPVQLPLWPEPHRGVPNSILRSALFGIVRRGRRRYLNKELIASWQGVAIRYTGMKLDQSDLDVWLLAVHLARHHTLGSQVRFSAYSFLDGIGRSRGKQNREWLKGVFTRLTASAVEISIGSRSYTGSLVHEFFHDADRREFVLTVNPRLAGLFDEGYSLLLWKSRNTLRTDLAKWVHCFVTSHSQGERHRIELDRLLELCGSESSHIREFRQRVREAMSELETLGAVKAWSLDNNSVLEFEHAGADELT